MPNKPTADDLYRWLKGEVAELPPDERAKFQNLLLNDPEIGAKAVCEIMYLALGRAIQLKEKDSRRSRPARNADRNSRILADIAEKKLSLTQIAKKHKVSLPTVRGIQRGPRKQCGTKTSGAAASGSWWVV